MDRYTVEFTKGQGWEKLTVGFGLWTSDKTTAL